MNAINVTYVYDVIHYVYCIKCNVTIYDYRLYINYIILYNYVTIDYDYYYYYCYYYYYFLNYYYNY